MHKISMLALQKIYIDDNKLKAIYRVTIFEIFIELLIKIMKAIKIMKIINV